MRRLLRRAYYFLVCNAVWLANEWVSYCWYSYIRASRPVDALTWDLRLEDAYLFRDACEREEERLYALLWPLESEGIEL